MSVSKGAPRSDDPSDVYPSNETDAFRWSTVRQGTHHANASTPHPRPDDCLQECLGLSFSGESQKRSRLLIVLNDARFFLSHRLEIAIRAKAAGYDVHVATPPSADVQEIVAAGLTHHSYSLTRGKARPLAEIRTAMALWKLFRSVKPDVVHLVTIKPVLFGGIIARMTGVPHVVLAVSGLGFIFLSRGVKARFVRAAVVRLYRSAFRSSSLRVVFQNADDRDELVGATGLDSSKVVRIRGSGVDLAKYLPTSPPAGIPCVVMASRLLRDKGVFEFVDAARNARQFGDVARFLLAGELDPANPASVTEEELAEWRNGGVVEVLGQCQDVAALFAQASIVVLPSYREGLPKVLMEAAACGRPVVTTDAPGCRDAIEPGVTGLLVPVRDSIALAAAIRLLLDDPGLRRSMGLAGRKMAEREFSVERVARLHLEMYRDLLKEIS